MVASCYCIFICLYEIMIELRAYFMFCIASDGWFGSVAAFDVGDSAGR